MNDNGRVEASDRGLRRFRSEPAWPGWLQPQPHVTALPPPMCSVKEPWHSVDCRDIAVCIAPLWSKEAACADARRYEAFCGHL